MTETDIQQEWKTTRFYMVIACREESWRRKWQPLNNSIADTMNKTCERPRWCHCRLHVEIGIVGSWCGKHFGREWGVINNGQGAAVRTVGETGAVKWLFTTNQCRRQRIWTGCSDTLRVFEKRRLVAWRKLRRCEIRSQCLLTNLNLQSYCDWGKVSWVVMGREIN